MALNEVFRGYIRSVGSVTVLFFLRSAKTTPQLLTTNHNHNHYQYPTPTIIIPIPTPTPVLPSKPPYGVFARLLTVYNTLFVGAEILLKYLTN